MTANVIMFDPVYHFAPTRYSISWLRAYSTPTSPEHILTNPLARIGMDYGLPVLATYQGDANFYDVQTTRRNHVARVVLAGLAVQMDPASEDWWPVRLHYLYHIAGFMLM